MIKICPKCGAIAEYNAYYGRITCTRCSWEDENYLRDSKDAAETLLEKANIISDNMEDI